MSKKKTYKKKGYVTKINMNIKEILEKIMNEYSDEKKHKFPGELFPPLKKLVPLVFKSDLNLGDEYTVKFGFGIGNWAKIPWIVIYKEHQNISPQKGYFVVILFEEDMSGFYITLNQGVNWFKEMYGMHDYKATLYLMGKHWADILKITKSTPPIPKYGIGTVYSCEMKKGNLNQEEILTEIKKALKYLGIIEIEIKGSWEEYNKKIIKDKIGL